MRTAQIVLAAGVLWLAYRALRGQWAELRRQPLPNDIDWALIAASAATFAIAYVVLIQTWRAILASWQSTVSMATATRIWTVSNLGRYIPGKIWQIAAMGMLAQRAGVSPIAATGSAVLGTVVNIAAGFVVVMATGWRLLALPYANAPVVAIGIVVVTIIAFVAIPWLAPRMTRLAGRVTGRTLQFPLPPPRAFVYAVVGNVIAWVLYGFAFQTLAGALFGSAPGGLAAYVAVYTLSYLIGYLVLPAPAGVGFREASMITLMPAAGLATGAQAAVLAITSRVVLTILDTAPGLAFLGRDSFRGPPRNL